MSDNHLLLKNISKLYCCTGLLDKRGRFPVEEDLHQQNSIDLLYDKSTNTVIDIDKNISSSAETIDASDLIACPAWVDSHTHTIFGGERASEYFMRWQGAPYEKIAAQGGGIHNSVEDTHNQSDETLIHTTLEKLKKMRTLGSGCVEIKTGYSNSAEQELRLLRLLSKVRKICSQNRDYPSVSVTYLALHALPKNKTEVNFVDEMISILPTVVNEGLADHVDAFPEVGFFTVEASLRFAKEAQRLGLQAKVHCDELNDLRSSEYFIAMGARSIDHLQKINKMGRSLLATSVTVATLMPATSFYLSLEYANARALIDEGATLALATDYNPGTAPHESMSLTQTLAASRMNMTPAEILAASTINGALAVGDTESGFIAKGKKAKINLFKESSLEEIFYSPTAPAYTIG